MSLELVSLFIIGLIVGSFLNVLIYRIPLSQNFLTGRSYCDNCKKNLKWYDLIPILSYISLKGKCRYCRSKIDPQILIVEFTTGFLFLAIFLKYPVIDSLLFFYLFVMSSLVAIFFIDFNKGIISDKILFPTFVIALFFIFLNPNFINHILSSIFSFVFFFGIYYLSKGKAMGFGDVKFAGVLGLIFGFPSIIVCIYLAFLTGAIASLILILCGKKHFKKDTIAFGPFLSLGAILTLFMGNLLVSLSLNFLR